MNLAPRRRHLASLLCALGALPLAACGAKPDARAHPSATVSAKPSTWSPSSAASSASSPTADASSSAASSASSPTADASSSATAGASSATAGPHGSATTVASGETIFIPATAGAQAGLPAIGIRLHGVWGGFAANAQPMAGTYLSLGGPPGGTLMFVVKGYRDADPSAAEAARLYRAQIAPMGDSVEPVIEGKPTTVRIAGAERPAVAFRTNRSLATSIWCVVQVPSKKLPRQGLFVSAGVRANEDDTPDCKRVVEHDQLAPLFASLELVE